MIAVLYIFAYFLAALALALLFPALVAIGLGEGAVGLDFLISAALWIFIAGAMMLSLRGRERRLRPAERYLLALLVWLLLPAVTTIPLMMTIDGFGFVDAYFEAVSGLTTTGASLLPPADELPRGIVLWLAMMQWFGGATTLLIVVLALAPLGVGGLPEAHSRLIEHGGLPEKRRLLLVFRDIFPMYLSATAITFILLASTELQAFEALCLAFSTISTGGFSPRSADIAEYVPTFGVVVMMVAMLYGATNVLWHRDLLHLRRVRAVSQRESVWTIGLCVGLGVVAGYAYFEAAGRGAGAAFRDGLFTATSLLTTSGFEIRNASFEIFPLAVVVIVMAIGAASFSTAGGIKLFRIGAMFIQGSRELNRLVYPHGVRPSKLGGQSYDIQTMKAIWVGFLAFVLAAITLSLVLASEGVPYEGAVLAALSALSNVGPVYSSDWAISTGWPAYAQMSEVARLALCMGMILGRLEVIAFLGLIVFIVRRG
ncbi:TrkH family potassium uptake protein [Microbaculum marinum]|uniref:Potassium transporter TrkG n=1 Tax=Microbaculum marinum TaxID=1764581 RepID=A0AAW9RLT3_9HYPH